MEKERYPSNAPGPFYVANGECLSCMAPEGAAPTLMGYEPRTGGGGHCYFKKQPVSLEETRQAMAAVISACCDALRYAGTDPSVLAELGPYCDHPSKEGNE